MSVITIASWIGVVMLGAFAILLLAAIIALVVIIIITVIELCKI